MGLELRSSSTTALGTPTATSLGGRPSNAAPSTAANALFDAITQSQNDAQTLDYRCVFVYNSGSTTITDVYVKVANRANGATVSLALDSTSPAAAGSYSTQTLANKNTAPTITGTWQASQVTIGTLTAGQVKAVWLKRTPDKSQGVANDYFTITATGTE